jgi:BirA family biotin operon repressor/biotin-[acetyl-CoA-carboxylase] ligase
LYFGKRIFVIGEVVTEYLRSGVLEKAVAETCSLRVGLMVHKTIDSTNSWSMQQCKEGKTMPFACFAESQTMGKGRRGKCWYMPANSNIAMSVCWPFDRSGLQLHLLPISIALAIVETLERFNIGEVQIKWPNDVYVQGKKIAGILIETQVIKGKLKAEEAINNSCLNKHQLAVVIGIGLNFDMSSLNLSDSGALPAFTDIESEMVKQRIEHKVGREEVATVLLQNVVSTCQYFQQNAEKKLQQFYARYDYCKDKTVDLMFDNGDILSGIARGVNENAELIVEINGESRAFNSVDVSVKASPK